MAELLRMPEVSANLETAVLSHWAIDEGETFQVKDVVAVIETEKAVVDFEIESAGVLVRKLVAEGAEVPVGEPIAVVSAVGETISDIDALVSRLSGGTAAPAQSSASSTAADETATGGPVVIGSIESGSAGERRFSSPLARKLAREAGLNLAEITGSGPGGRIVRRDISAVVVRLSEEPSTVVAVQAPLQVPLSPTGVAGYVDTPHSRLRKLIASRLVESKATAPHFYVRGSAEVAVLLRMREEINTGGDVRVSLNDLLIKAVGRAHVLVPGLNVIWTPEAIRSFTSVDVSVAISTPGGLVTPVIRGVDRLSVTDVSRIVKDFAERGRAGRLQQSELEGGTVTISNLGMFGTEDFAAIINPPQASILAVGATKQEALVRDGEITIGTVLRYTLSVDHRPVDGVLAAEWVRAFTELLQSPARILA